MFESLLLVVVVIATCAKSDLVVWSDGFESVSLRNASKYLNPYVPIQANGNECPKFGSKNYAWWVNESSYDRVPDYPTIMTTTCWSDDIDITKARQSDYFSNFWESVRQDVMLAWFGNVKTLSFTQMWKYVYEIWQYDAERVITTVKPRVDKLISDLENESTNILSAMKMDIWELEREVGFLMDKIVCECMDSNA